MEQAYAVYSWTGNDAGVMDYFYNLGIEPQIVGLADKHHRPTYYYQLTPDMILLLALKFDVLIQLNNMNRIWLDKKGMGFSSR